MRMSDWSSDVCSSDLLKRFGGLNRLKQGLDAVRANGMEAVLGDGLGSEIHNWLEACVARTTIRNAGEFNGFLKPRERRLTPPMTFRDGSLHLPAGHRPGLDHAATERSRNEKRDFCQATKTTQNHEQWERSEHEKPDGK